MSRFRETLRQDAKMYCLEGRRQSVISIYLKFPGFRFTFWYRVRKHLGNGRGRLFAKLATLIVLWQQRRTGIQINPGADIGAGLYIPHFGSIVVNPNTKIGKGLYLSHGVTIGKVHAGPRMGVPTIGDGVFIAAGAVLVGNIQVGHNSVIGPNSVVIEDVPENAVVSGSPARIVSMKGAQHVLGRKGEDEVASNKEHD